MNFPHLPLSFLDSLGGLEIVVIMFVALMLFGGEKLPEFARGLGRAIREFKKATSGVEEEIKKAMEAPPPLQPARTPPTPAAIMPPTPPAPGPGPAASNVAPAIEPPAPPHEKLGD